MWISLFNQKIGPRLASFSRQLLSQDLMSYIVFIVFIFYSYILFVGNDSLRDLEESYKVSF